MHETQKQRPAGKEGFYLNGNFYFDGVSAEEVGVMIVRINTSDDTMPLLGSQAPTMQQVMNQDFSTFIRTRKENMRLTMFFTLTNDVRGPSFTNERLRTLGKFFARSIPIEFKVEEDMAKVIHIVPTSAIELVRFSEMKGYFQITFHATTPYWLSPMEVLTFDLATARTFQVINRRNIQDRHGNYDVYPRIVIRNMAAAANFALANSSPRGGVVTFRNVTANERIEMHHRIVRAQNNQGIFHSWNRQPFYLVENVNNFTVTSACAIDVHLQYPVF